MTDLHMPHAGEWFPTGVRHPSPDWHAGPIDGCVTRWRTPG
jgi:hypothetical protein